jgi:hypothetical protein
MHGQSRGFSLIEIITIVTVIGILAAIVVVSATGIARISRDNQRQLNVNAIAERLELYYKLHTSAAGRSYPVKQDMQTKAQEVINDNEALIAPGKTGNSLVATDTTGEPMVSVSEYVYQVFDADDNICTSVPCVRFVLYYRTESDNTVHRVESLHQQ